MSVQPGEIKPGDGTLMFGGGVAIRRCVRRLRSMFGHFSRNSASIRTSLWFYLLAPQQTARETPELSTNYISFQLDVRPSGCCFDLAADGGAHKLFDPSFIEIPIERFFLRFGLLSSCKRCFKSQKQNTFQSQDS